MSEERFYELPVGWAETVLGALGSVGSSKRVHQKDWKSEGIPFFRAREIAKLSKNGTVANDLFISKELFRELSKFGFVPSRGDVMITGVGTIGVPYIVKDQDAFYFKDASVLIFKNDHRLDPRYLYFYFKSYNCRQWIIEGSTGTTVDTLTIGRARDIPIPLAPLTEQKRIADKLEAVLGRVDACRTRLDHVPTLLKRFRQSVLAAAMSGKLTEEWRDENTDRETVPLRDAIKTIRTGPFGSSLHKADYVSGGTPIVNPMHINDGKIFPTDRMTVDKATLKRLSDFKISTGDVIIGRRGEMGRCAVITAVENGWMCGTGSMVLTPCATLCPEYLQIFLSSPATVHALEGKSVGSTMVNLNQKILLDLEIFFPSLPEQQEIVRRVEDLFAFADRIEARLATAQKTVERLTPATLAKAFRGELVPQDPNDEPASSLLARLHEQQAAAPPKPARKKRAKQK